MEARRSILAALLLTASAALACGLALLWRNPQAEYHADDFVLGMEPKLLLANVAFIAIPLTLWVAGKVWGARSSWLKAAMGGVVLAFCLGVVGDIVQMATSENVRMSPESLIIFNVLEGALAHYAASVCASVMLFCLSLAACLVLAQRRREPAASRPRGGL